MLESRFTSGWAAERMQDSFAFLILGVDRLREDQFIYVETRGGTVHQRNPSHSVCLSQFGARVYRLVHRHEQLLFLIYKGGEVSTLQSSRWQYRARCQPPLNNKKTRSGVADSNRVSLGQLWRRLWSWRVEKCRS